jgi:hypothetical protein
MARPRPRPAGPAAWVLGALGACLAGLAGGLVVADMVNHPRDLWGLVLFTAGSLVGWAWDHRGPPRV